MSRVRVNRYHDAIRRVDARFLVLSLLLAGIAVALWVRPAHSATSTVNWGSYMGGGPNIVVTEGDRVRFTIGSGRGNNHSVEITELGISSGKLDEGDAFLTPVLDTPGQYLVWCKTHKNQGHEATLVVVAAPATTTTTTTAGPTTTTTTTAGPTTTTAGPTSTTTTTAAPGGGSTTTAPPGPGTTVAGGSGTTATSTSVVEAGSSGETDGRQEVPIPDEEDSGDGTSGATQSLGSTSSRASDPAWLRPLWWVILAGSLMGLVWVAFAWRRQPTEYD